jgi:hypothetical protein
MRKVLVRKRSGCKGFLIAGFSILLLLGEVIREFYGEASWYENGRDVSV